ncbi:hypothetical protein Sjap_025665 [Stephania japonica]|uniref:Uncharacterized protein n=1 Tax=Stephania japonica TaxID=461633 RepID=A0AAP0E9Y6_9MAGN
MLQHFLAQLPKFVLKEVDDSSVEDCEERVRFIRKHLCKLDFSLEDKGQLELTVNGYQNC